MDGKRPIGMSVDILIHVTIIIHQIIFVASHGFVASVNKSACTMVKSDQCLLLCL